jgi:hypothetical protein
MWGYSDKVSSLNGECLVTVPVNMNIKKVKVKVKVKQSLYRPGVAQRVPGS